MPSKAFLIRQTESPSFPQFPLNKLCPQCGEETEVVSVNHLEPDDIDDYHCCNRCDLLFPVKTHALAMQIDLGLISNPILLYAGSSSRGLPEGL